MKRAKDMPVPELERFVGKLQEVLYLVWDGEDFMYDPAKSWDIETLDKIKILMGQYKLCPDQRYTI